MNEDAPVTPKVPAMVVFPDAATTLNLFVFTAKSPVEESVPLARAEPAIVVVTVALPIDRAEAVVPPIDIVPAVPAPVGVPVSIVIFPLDAA